MQDPHVLHVGPFPTPFPERVVGQPEVHGRKELLAEAVAGEGSRLAHQGADDVAVIDVGFPLAMGIASPKTLLNEVGCLKQNATENWEAATWAGT